MLRSILSMALPLVAGQGVKATIKSLARRIAAVLAAAVLLATALAFGLVALYALLRDSGLEVDEAAGLMAAGLASLAVLILAIALLGKRKSRTRAARLFTQRETGPAGVVDQQVERLVQQVGPFSLLAAAFAIGLAAGRK